MLSASLGGAQYTEQPLRQLRTEGLLETGLRRRAAKLGLAEREAVAEEVEVPIAGAGARFG